MCVHSLFFSLCSFFPWFQFERRILPSEYFRGFGTLVKALARLRLLHFPRKEDENVEWSINGCTQGGKWTVDDRALFPPTSNIHPFNSIHFLMKSQKRNKKIQIKGNITTKKIENKVIWKLIMNGDDDGDSDGIWILYYILQQRLIFKQKGKIWKWMVMWFFVLLLVVS